MKRTETRSIRVKDVQIGAQNRVVIQSMCNTRTKDIKATVDQILKLESVGCEMVRLAIIDMEDATAIQSIKAQTHIPLVADIHFDYRLAIACVESGIDKIRLNPGNIGSKENVAAVVAICKERNIPIRIGINSGSLEKDIHEKYGKPTAEGMMESAKRHVSILEELDFHDIVLSFKSSDPLLCIEAYRLASTTFPYPLHLGVTEAGTYIGSAIKSSMALGTLLNEGIGDTIRISVNGDP
ncbi:MAG: flavodoxin/ferredoxin-dependent (E)-4-hydroxy-3-methylbut-2-enyl-diphosphate synthase, partial [Longicatena sp.]